MVHFVEKMFEVVVEPPQTPVAFFSADFTRDKLDEQVAMGRIGPGNLPVYVSNIVYGRMMAFTFTSTASMSDIKAALNAAYRGMGSFSANAQSSTRRRCPKRRSRSPRSAARRRRRSERSPRATGRTTSTSAAPLSSAYPISYTFRNLGDGSIAKVQEGTEYKIKECQPAGGGSFILDSFESPEHDVEPAQTRRRTENLADHAALARCRPRRRASSTATWRSRT
jgi:hypothetical protein